MPNSLCFYVWISTEPIQAGNDKSGCGASAVVFDAPSPGAVEQWADGFADHMILDHQKDQKFKEKRIIQLSSTLLSSTGHEELDWTELAQAVSKAAKDPKHFEESCGSTMLDSSHMTDPSSLPEGWDSPQRLRGQLPKQYADKLNWEEANPGFYVLHDQKRGMIIKAANTYLAFAPFMKWKHKDAPTGPKIYLKTCPRIEQYK